MAKTDQSCAMCKAAPSEHMYAATLPVVESTGKIATDRDKRDKALTILDADAIHLCGGCFTAQFQEKFGVAPDGVVIDKVAVAAPKAAG